MTKILESAGVVTSITRQEIEDGNIDAALEFLQAMGILCIEEADDRILSHLQAKVAITVDGYDNDPRELYQVPEVRDYFQRLHKVWPYGLFFFSRELQTLKLLVLCHAESMNVSGDAVMKQFKFSV